MKWPSHIRVILCTLAVAARANIDAAQLRQEDFLQLPVSPSTAHTIQILRGDISAGNITPITITRPGIYRLNGPLRATGANTALTIAANNVTLELDGHTISGGATGIVITGTNVTVKNGTVQNASAVGVAITGSNCQISSVDAVNSSTGFLLQNSVQNTLTNCRALQSSSAGFSLVSSSTNSITSCLAINTQSDNNNACGFISHSGYGNTFNQCRAQNTRTAATNNAYCAAGFLLGDTKSIITQCQADDTHALTPYASAYGMYAPLLDLLDSKTIGATVYSVDWTSDGHYLAVGGSSINGYEIRIYTWNERSEILDLVATASTTPTSPIISIAWSPNDNYLAASAYISDAKSQIILYTWNGTTLTQKDALSLGNVDNYIQSISWSPDDTHISCVNIMQEGYILSWNGTNVTLSDTIAEITANSICWLSDAALVLGCYYIDGTNLRTYTWNGTKAIPANTYNAGTSNSINVIKRSPAGAYIALGGSGTKYPGGEEADSIYVYAFSGTTLTPIASTFPGESVNSLAWSADSTQLITGKENSPYLRLLSWLNNNISELGSLTTLQKTSVVSVSYSPIGIIASCGLATTDNFQVGAWKTQKKNSITRNIATHTTTSDAQGIGICAPSTMHYIAANTAYDNDINYQDIASEYITSQVNTRGVYNTDSDNTTVDRVETISQAITPIAPEQWSIESKVDVIGSKVDTLNVDLNADFWTIESKCDIISSKIDPLLPAIEIPDWSIESKQEYVASTIDTIESMLEVPDNNIDALAACDQTPIATSGSITSNKIAITGDVTLATSGCYCLSAPLGTSTTGASLTISGNDITLDLNGYSIECNNTKATGITIIGNGVTVRNGIIQNATANGVSLTGDRCTLENLTVVTTATGFYMNSASACALTNCRALHCTQNGFLLSNCTDNTLDSCHVINVGGSTASSINVYGVYASGGQRNTFTNCTVDGAYTNYANVAATAQGFRLVAEDYDTITNCTVNGVITSSTLPNVYGIRAPLTQIQGSYYTEETNSCAVACFENRNNRYIAIDNGQQVGKCYLFKYYAGGPLLSKVTDFGNGTYYSLDWLKSPVTSAFYIAAGGSPGLQMYQFTEPTTISSKGSVSLATVQSVDWLTCCTSGSPRYYIAAASSAGNFAKVYEFAEAPSLNQRATQAIAATCISWLPIGPKAYVALGTSSAIQVREFTGTALASVTSVSSAQQIYNVKWLTTSNNTYYLAASKGGTSGTFNHPMVEIYTFAPATGTLTLRATYSPASSLVNGVCGLAWLQGVDDLNYLAIGYNSKAQILRFDGYCLTPIYTSDGHGGPAYSLDWLATNITMLAVGYPDINAFAFSPTQNNISNNVIMNVRGGANATAYAVDANNVLDGNTAYNNDTNYFYTPGPGDSNQGY